MNWAAPLIGLPWAPGGDGPCAFSCWGLVRHGFRVQHQVEMPRLAIAEPDQDNVRAIKQAARVSGWRPVASGAALDGDIVLMTAQVTLHCGLAMRANGTLGVLHSTPATGVTWQPWKEATQGMRIELWRRAP